MGGSPGPSVFCRAGHKTEVLWSSFVFKQYNGVFSVHGHASRRMERPLRRVRRCPRARKTAAHRAQRAKESLETSVPVRRAALVEWLVRAAPLGPAVVAAITSRRTRMRAKQKSSERSPADEQARTEPKGYV
jgi:hypothetical protein